MTHVVAISATPELEQSVERFIESVKNGRDDSADRYIEMMDHITDRVLKLFLVEPRDSLRLGRNQQRVMDFAISTAGKASHMLTRQIFRKKKPDELKAVAENVRQMYWPASANNEERAFITYPAEQPFARDFIDARDACQTDREAEPANKVPQIMDQLTDDIIEHFFLRNARQVDIGYMTRKALETGTEGTRRAVHAVNHKVLRGLDNKHLCMFMEHYNHILRERQPSG